MVVQSREGDHLSAELRGEKSVLQPLSETVVCSKETDMELTLAPTIGVREDSGQGQIADRVEK
jgi:hypothetical protein